MRNALRQLKRELSKVQDTHAAAAPAGSIRPEDAAAQLRKESSGGFTLARSAGHAEEGARDTVPIGGALAAAATARDRRPAKLSTIEAGTDADKNATQSMLRMR